MAQTFIPVSSLPWQRCARLNQHTRHTGQVHDSAFFRVGTKVQKLQVREENGQLALQLAQSQRCGRETEQANERLQTKVRWLQEQKRASEAEALRCQTCRIDVSAKLELLTTEHERAMDELHQQKRTVQVVTCICFVGQACMTYRSLSHVHGLHVHAVHAGIEYCSWTCGL